MSAPVFDFKITFRPGFQADMDARFAKLQFAFSQKVAATVDPYVPFDTGTLKNSVNQASDFKEGLLVYNTMLLDRGGADCLGPGDELFHR